MKKMKTKKKKYDVKISIRSVEMTPKLEVILVEDGLFNRTEEEIRILVKAIEKENREIKKNYYSLNSQVEAVQKRKFIDLVKIFLSKMPSRTAFECARSVRF